MVFPVGSSSSRAVLVVENLMLPALESGRSQEGEVYGRLVFLPRSRLVGTESEACLELK